MKRKWFEANASLENVMDKQREEFEAWLKDCNKHVYDVYKDGYSSSDNVENMCVEWAWQAWQQSQKVAVSDGGVNLNKFDLLRKMHNIRDLNNGDYYSDEIEENICAVEAMIEAQEN